MASRCITRHEPTTSGKQFIKIGQAVEAELCPNVMGLETSPSCLTPSTPEPIYIVLMSKGKFQSVVNILNSDFEVSPRTEPTDRFLGKKIEILENNTTSIIYW